MAPIESATSDGPHNFPRLQRVFECVEAVETLVTRCSSAPNVVERIALGRSKEQLGRIDSQNIIRRHHESGKASEEDRAFGDDFLDLFTQEAFRQELDILRQVEGDKMTGSDFATLADSIRSFGIGIPEKNREYLLRDYSPS